MVMVSGIQRLFFITAGFHILLCPCIAVGIITLYLMSGTGCAN